MFDDFDLYETCEEFYYDDFEYDPQDLEIGFDPYAGDYTYDC